MNGDSGGGSCGRLVNTRPCLWGVVCTLQTCFCVSLRLALWSLTGTASVLVFQAWPRPAPAHPCLLSSPDPGFPLPCPVSKASGCGQYSSPGHAPLPAPSSSVGGSSACLVPAQPSGLIIRSGPQGSLLHLQTYQLPLPPLPPHSAAPMITVPTTRCLSHPLELLMGGDEDICGDHTLVTALLTSWSWKSRAERQSTYFEREVLKL